MMMYTDDARIVSSNVEHHHGPQAWEQLVGNEWWGAGYARKLQAYEGYPTKQKFNYPGQRDSGQHVTYIWGFPKFFSSRQM